MITGRCECGRISYEADCTISDFGHCHCSQCRRLHGAAFASFATVESDKFRYVTGEDDIKLYASSHENTRVFCGNCGSNILVLSISDPEEIYLCMGTVDGDPKLPEPYHAYVGSKAPWHEITDGAKQFDGEAAG